MRFWQKFLRTLSVLFFSAKTLFSKSTNLTFWKFKKKHVFGNGVHQKFPRFKTKAKKNFLKTVEIGKVKKPKKRVSFKEKFKLRVNRAVISHSSTFFRRSGQTLQKRQHFFVRKPAPAQIAPMKVQLICNFVARSSSKT